MGFIKKQEGMVRSCYSDSINLKSYEFEILLKISFPPLETNDKNDMILGRPKMVLDDVAGNMFFL